MPHYAIIAIAAAAVAAVLLTALVTHWITRRQDIRKVAYMMDAFEDGELNFRYEERNRFNRTLNRIRTLFERQRSTHEQDSWNKLIRVLTHEIMNTVSPIASLSDALCKSMDEQGHSDLDVKAGLETISDSSRNLIKFVQTYRLLSGVTRPVRGPVKVAEWVEKVVSLNSEYIASCQAVCHTHIHHGNATFYADEGQISQILINLIKNALQAKATQIDIHTQTGPNGEIVVKVANNGTPIPYTSREQIFMPFFTTKTEGSGIGLSISRQIMHQHNGSIELLRSDQKETVFMLVFR